MTDAIVDRLVDPFAARVVLTPPDRLQPFNAAGVLGPGDVHAAEAICRLVGEEDPDVLLAAAMAVRAPRYGHTCVDLRSAADGVIAEDEGAIEAGDLGWPEPPEWRAAVAASPAVAAVEGNVEPEASRPLVLDGDLLYLDRFWRYERRLAERILALAAVQQTDALAAVAEDHPLLGDRPEQRAANLTALRRSFTVVAGGPGTGKTFTVARLIAVALTVAAQADQAPPRIAVAAPTGKAAARLTEQLRARASELPVGDEVREALLHVEAKTIHRLLGRSRDSDSRFRHSAAIPLDVDMVIVDESSMVSLSNMAALVDAVPEGARLILVGDPDQLESVEAGSVLGDLMGPFADAVLGESPSEDEVGGAPLAEAVAILREGHRFLAGTPIAELARAVHAGNAQQAVALLTTAPSHEEGQPQIELIKPDDPSAWPSPVGTLAPVFERVGAAARAVMAAAELGDAEAALEAVRTTQVLCATRRGPAGVYAWNRAIERWLGIPAWGPETYAGRPVLATSNDYRLGIFNGDLGVVIRSEGRFRIAFDTATGVMLLDPRRIDGLETVHAMTIHKSQGSQFNDIVVAVPSGSARTTRNLLYTAVTRASERATIVADEVSLHAVVDRRVRRMSGLTARLQRPGSTPG